VRNKVNEEDLPEPFERLAMLEEAVEELLNELDSLGGLEDMPDLAAAYHKVRLVMDLPTKVKEREN
jgi:hypothetical protein